MNYIIVKIKEKQVVGIHVRTSNQEKDMINKITTTWQHFYEGIYKKEQENFYKYTYGLYCNYESDVNHSYDFVACGELKSNTELSLYERYTIPSGTYARFEVKLGMKNIGSVWEEIWKTPLYRSYECDFEEYDLEQETVYIYIGILS